MRLERVKLDRQAPESDRKAYGLTGSAQFELKPLAPGAFRKVAA